MEKLWSTSSNQFDQACVPGLNQVQLINQSRPSKLWLLGCFGSYYGVVMWLLGCSEW